MNSPWGSHVTWSFSFVSSVVSAAELELSVLSAAEELSEAEDDSLSEEADEEDSDELVPPLQPVATPRDITAARQKAAIFEIFVFISVTSFFCCSGAAGVSLLLYGIAYFLYLGSVPLSGAFLYQGYNGIYH